MVLIQILVTVKTHFNETVHLSEISLKQKHEDFSPFFLKTVHLLEISLKQKYMKISVCYFKN